MVKKSYHLKYITTVTNIFFVVLLFFFAFLSALFIDPFHRIIFKQESALTLRHMKTYGYVEQK